MYDDVLVPTDGRRGDGSNGARPDEDARYGRRPEVVPTPQLETAVAEYDE